MEKEIQIPDGFEAKIEGNKIIFVPKVSEDEKVRKALLRCCDDWEKGQFGCMAKEDIPAVRAWLEKQKTSEEAIRYLKENHSSEKVSDFQTAMNIAVARAYDKGVQDILEKQKEHPTNEEMLRTLRAEYEKGVADTIAKYEQNKQKLTEWSYPYGRNETANRLVSIAECLEMDGDCLFNGYSGTECAKFLRDLARKQVECIPAEWSEEEAPDETKQEWRGSIDIPGSIKTSRIGTIENILSYFKYERKATQEEIRISFIPCLENLLKEIEQTNVYTEWGEVDDALLKEIVSFFKDGTVKLQHDLDLYAGFLENKFRYLRPQPRWKPSEEDLTALEYCAEHNCPELLSLYYELKKLM